MQFQKGQSGNPAARPRGSRDKASIRLQEMLEQTAEKPFNRAVELAMAGNIAALRPRAPCFPCYFLFFPVPDPAISAEVLAGTHFFAGFGCRPAPFTGIYRQGKPMAPMPANPAATAKA